MMKGLMKRLFPLKIIYAVPAVVLAALCFYGCELSALHSQATQPPNEAASSDFIAKDSSQPPSAVSASSIEQQERSESEIIAACVLHFEQTDLGSRITEPFSSIKEYAENPDNQFQMKVAAYYKLLACKDIKAEAALYGDESIPCYPIAICNRLTEQMFGLTLDWTDASLGVPEGTFVMPYGYGQTMVSSKISEEDCYIENNQIYLSATEYWNEYGEAPRPINRLLYQFAYKPQNDLCQFTLVGLSAEPI